MSCNYAEGLSPYDNKGILGTPERFDKEQIVDQKCSDLASWIKTAKHVVVHTGAGISTAAGIPDFRGPNGVWTLEKQGKKPNINISFDDSIPTKTHMVLKKLLEAGYIHYIISQNIDGLHLRTGVSRSQIAELHGNMFVEQCNVCESKFVRSTATTTVGKKLLGVDCRRGMLKKRTCRGKMQDTILDWEDNLPERDLEMSEYHSSLADLNICLGTTLQIVPSGNLPLKCKKYGGKVVIVNLQPTKHDKKADLIINTYVDDVLEKVSEKLGLQVPIYSKEDDPTKNLSPGMLVNWDIPQQLIKTMKAQYEVRCKQYKKRKLEEKKFGQNKIPKITDMKRNGMKYNIERCMLKNESSNFDTVDLTEDDDSSQPEKNLDQNVDDVFEEDVDDTPVNCCSKDEDIVIIDNAKSALANNTPSPEQNQTPNRNKHNNCKITNCSLSNIIPEIDLT